MREKLEPQIIRHKRKSRKWKSSGSTMMILRIQPNIGVAFLKTEIITPHAIRKVYEENAPDDRGSHHHAEHESVPVVLSRTSGQKELGDNNTPILLEKARRRNFRQKRGLGETGK